MKREGPTIIKRNLSETDFSGSAPCQKRPKNAQNKRSWAIFCNFLNINISTNQQMIELNVFRQDS